MSELPSAPIPDTHASQTVGLQIGDHRVRISCAVVERPYHHCGDDLVYNIAIANHRLLTLNFFDLMSSLWALVRRKQIRKTQHKNQQLETANDNNNNNNNNTNKLITVFGARSTRKMLFYRSLPR